MKSMAMIVFLVLIYVINVSFASTTTARDGITYEKCGDNVDWTFDESSRTLKFNGTGDMYSFSSKDLVPWFGYMSKIERFEMNGDITSIADYAFYGCSNLTSADISECVKTIGNYSFAECKKLNVLNLPSITIIGLNTFRFCTSLTSVILPQSITEIRNGAFYGCVNLKSINIPESVTSISSYAFSECTSLTSIILPKYLKEIESNAFSGCFGLKSISIPDGVTKIGSQAFQDCSSLTSVDLPKSVTEIEQYAFSACTELQSINIPDNVETIDFGTFSHCSSLTSVVVPPSVTEIRNGAFSGCSGLKFINIPDNVAHIGTSAFDACQSLASIILSQVLTIMSRAFDTCTSLKFVMYDGTEEPSCDENIFNSCPVKYVCVPQEYDSSSFCGLNVVKSSSCSTLVNKCFISEYSKNEWHTEKTNDTIEWENRTSECATYYCDNETGYGIRSECRNEEICVESKCVDEEEKTETTVVIEVGSGSGITISTFNSDEFKNIIHSLTNSTTNNLKIGVKVDEDGMIKRIIVYVDDKDIANKIASSLGSIKQSGECYDEYRVFCQTTEIFVKSKTLTISPGSRITIPYLLLLSSLIIFIDI